MIIRADARALPLRDGCVDCCVTSPPYWGLRDYGVSGQLGLEPTPDLYVAALVAVFREVARVLKPAGTVWLNLGDSYAQHSARAGQNNSTHSYEHTNDQFRNQRYSGGVNISAAMAQCKPKDLVGIPWSVAKALQAPYYMGRIHRETDRVWLAAMVDGEGCFYVHRRKVGQHAGDGYFRQTDTYSPAMEVANTHEAIVLRCAEIAGCGSVIRQDKDRRQPLYRWTARSDEARQIAREIYPYLVGKRQQAQIVYGMPASGELAEAAWQAMKVLHAGGLTDVTFPEPSSCFEPGWYLRSDVIWSKPNPMPESVTDRPTKAHEYVFLLTKAERYFYDAAAIAERSVDPESLRGRNARNDDKFAQHDPDGMARTRMGFAKIKAGTVYETRNARSVWTIPTMPYAGAHFATMPEALVEPCILAGCPLGGLVLDPFLGSGTVGYVAERLGRRWVGTDLAYHDLSTERTAQRGIRFDEPEEVA